MELMGFAGLNPSYCFNTRLALDVGVLRIGELAARKRDEHGRVLAVAAILVAELLDQIVLFELDADQDVAGDHRREQQMANAHRRLKVEGVPPDQAAKAVRLIARTLEREGPLLRSEIAERLRRESIRIEGQAIAHLVWLAAAEGLICYGPDRDGEQCFVLVRDWVGKPRPIERDAALTELAVRYLTAHAPALPADLAFWSGIRLTDANRAWKAIQDRLLAVETKRGTRWRLRCFSSPSQ